MATDAFVYPSNKNLGVPHTGFLLPDVGAHVRPRENFDAKMIAIF